MFRTPTPPSQVSTIEAAEIALKTRRWRSRNPSPPFQVPLDYYYSVIPPSYESPQPSSPLEERSPLPESPPQQEPAMRLATSPRAKHHCLLQGHVWQHLRLSKLPPNTTVGDLPLPSEGAVRKRHDVKVNCDVCKAVVQEYLWQCEIPACRREVCRECGQRLEKEKRNKAVGSWSRGK
ncbi:MAG: hypothetical protein M1827_000338 [Pycnora praestabilis]|nr:MAG: hypothetical protein M1827_000338 [Pycnora praestabilis]